MQKKTKYIFLKIGLVIVFLAACFIFFGTNTSYVKATWAIKIPTPDKEEYHIENRGWSGDGEEYIIDKYTDSKKIKSLESDIEWMNQKNTSMESSISNVLKELKVPNEKYPNFNTEYSYYRLQKYDHSKIYLLYYEQEKKLYIIENFE